MATPNYGYEKRQRELAKKRKTEEKKQKKLQGGGPGQADDAADGPAGANTAETSDAAVNPAPPAVG